MANILIVDDAFITRNKLKTILTSAGHKIIGEGTDGKEAISLYDKLLPDLVTMDITMPNLTGIEAAEKIINKHPNARIVMVSAVLQKAILLKAIEMGAKHYIIKPFEPDKVKEIISNVLLEDGFIEPGTETTEKIEICKKEEELRFYMENKNRRIIFYPTQYDIGINLVDAIEGILFIKPLTVLINIISVEKISKAFFAQLSEAIDKVRDANGKIEIYTNFKLLEEFQNDKGYNKVMSAAIKDFDY
jgi:two-component system chemotaxis response regulator CheY